MSCPKRLIKVVVTDALGRAPDTVKWLHLQRATRCTRCHLVQALVTQLSPAFAPLNERLHLLYTSKSHNGEQIRVVPSEVPLDGSFFADCHDFGNYPTLFLFRTARHPQLDKHGGMNAADDEPQYWHEHPEGGRVPAYAVAEVRLLSKQSDTRWLKAGLRFMSEVRLGVPVLVPLLMDEATGRLTATETLFCGLTPYRTEAGMPVMNAPLSELLSSVFMRFRSYETCGKWPCREQPVEEALRWIDFEPQVPRLTAILRYSTANGLYEQTTSSFWSRLMAVNDPIESQVVGVVEPMPVSSRKRRLETYEARAAEPSKKPRSLPNSQRSWFLRCLGFKSA
ncbi:hypothetical protein Vretimale_5392 [Volvox reticuliferus]|uniref:Uncharacterized protein n=1 Tax=Volvox reticuliferus TaxID=1737510 RepID=A0A8J4C853_9CHLO|nr:hypothetical protein Vretifemale_3850 [Volvox reticuliferus]GIM00247.1 hypothetical protein Vretimale_5392 [Volvox reticuliferus]